ncbi:hypothetical protein [Actinophytocola sp.]|uniref:hypothetical protein n=1 Tax=Actinophytocola sp. TaxID=1872138 RepID=UPI003899908B
MPTGGGEPEEQAEWLAAGFAAEAAQDWRTWGMRIAQAREWLAAGVPDGRTAAEWAFAGVTPQTVTGWLEAGIPPADAIRYREFGVGLADAAGYHARGMRPDQVFARQPPPGLADASQDEAVLRFHEAGVGGFLLHGYLERRWHDDTALAWAIRDVPAPEARLWHELGVTPAEGAALAAAGVDPVRAVREWWSAGIPFEEVADWLGAGMTPAEAARQRADGVTVEQAAMMRMLRRDEDPH